MGKRIKFMYSTDKKIEKIAEYNAESVMDALKKFEKDHKNEKNPPMVVGMDVVDKNWKGEH